MRFAKFFQFFFAHNHPAERRDIRPRPLPQSLQTATLYRHENIVKGPLLFCLRGKFQKLRVKQRRRFPLLFLLRKEADNACRIDNLLLQILKQFFGRSLI